MEFRSFETKLCIYSHNRATMFSYCLCFWSVFLDDEWQKVECEVEEKYQEALEKLNTSKMFVLLTDMLFIIISISHRVINLFKNLLS